MSCLEKEDFRSSMLKVRKGVRMDILGNEHTTLVLEQTCGDGGYGLTRTVNHAAQMLKSFIAPNLKNDAALPTIVFIRGRRHKIILYLLVSCRLLMMMSVCSYVWKD
uniref:Uncharacterized protein n=1 Tax=Glossina austeni TaxID=7395 RepID=A0A1A9VE88_GLOAU